MPSSFRRPPAGLSVLEVMFAMGIATFGLLGIATLLPLAGRNAADSNRLAESQALAHRWYDDLIVSGALDKSNWIFYRDFASPPIAAGYYGFSGVPGLPANKNGHNTATRVIAKQAVCIDPYFMSSRDIRLQLAAGNFNEPINASHRWYRPAVFPFYQDAFNPVVDPAYTVAAQSSYALPDQPRMVRVTLGSGALGQINTAALNAIFGATDDLIVDTDETDRTLPPTRNMASARATLANAKMTSKNEYSWIATVCPNETLVNDDAVSSALLSVVVLHKRDFGFYDTTSPPTRGAEPDTEGKPQGELLFRVVPQYGPGGPVSFVGGHGGTVTLVASDGVSSKVHVGGWVMLAKNRFAGTVNVPVFRWYRIVATDGEPEVGNIASFDPTATSTSAPDEVWARKVVLEGPDWVFDSNPTTATYMPGAVAVYERMIPW